MKDKGLLSIIGGVLLISTSVPIYNYYILTVIRHKELMDKIDGFDEQLKNWNKIENNL